MNLGELRARVKVDQGFDVSDTLVDAVLNERYQRLWVDSRWRVVTFSLGSTVNGTAEYAVSASVLALDLVLVSGLECERVTENQIDALVSGRERLYPNTGEYGVFSASEGASLFLWPVPDEDGLALTGRGVLAPDPLVDDADVPAIPLDAHPGLAHGAIAELLGLDDERFDVAEVYERKFAGTVVSLRRRRLSRVGGENARLSIVGRG